MALISYFSISLLPLCITSAACNLAYVLVVPAALHIGNAVWMSACRGPSGGFRDL